MIFKRKFLSIFLIILGLLVGLFLVAYILFQVSKSRNFQFFGDLVHRFDTNQKIVALTFDDGPTVYTEEVLQILSENQVKATFYLIGQDLEKHPEMAKKIIEEGHEMGNHSYSHPRFLLKSLSFVEGEIEKTNELIRDSGYKDEITFRPPYGKKLFSLPYYLSMQGITTVMWDLEPDTYYPGNAEAMVNYVIQNVQPGSIILMHPHCPKDCLADREALPEIIKILKSKGYEFVTVTEAINYKIIDKHELSYRKRHHG